MMISSKELVGFATDAQWRRGVYSGERIVPRQRTGPTQLTGKGAGSNPANIDVSNEPGANVKRKWKLRCDDLARSIIERNLRGFILKCLEGEDAADQSRCGVMVANGGDLPPREHPSDLMRGEEKKA
jgi:hypothetical protein